MLTSARWLNDYLDPPATAEEQAALLTAAGFPLESSEPADDGDVRQDFETTSNRGDCVSHLGLAREIAARSARTLKVPGPRPQGTGAAAATLVQVHNHEPERCPLYTARVIRGVTVRPSPPWLRQRLLARGDIPRNNIVDATNFVLHEWGQPTHVFDLGALEGHVINIRMARDGEPFLPIGEEAGQIRLTRDDLVIADARSPVALAGVKGGALSAVSESTTDILLEAATFDPVCVRRSSRRHGIASDSSYRFERGVHPAQVERAADRLAALILETAGGQLAPGVVAAGRPIPRPREVSMRVDRACAILGLSIDEPWMIDALERLGFAVRRADRVLHCTVPPERLDIEREIDLIEEVGRLFGHDAIPIAATVEVRVVARTPGEESRRALSAALVAMGFVESVTHSLIAEEQARRFLLPGQQVMRLQEERAGADRCLRPSLLPSLMRVRAHNRHQGVRELKLFEMAAAYWRDGEGDHREMARIGLLADQVDPALGLRPLRGALEHLVRLLLGPQVTLEAEADDTVPWFTCGALVRAGGATMGRLGLVAPQVLAAFDLAQPCLAAELDIGHALACRPPQPEAHALPAFPAIERDVSAIIPEDVTWAEVHRVRAAQRLDMLEAIEFVTVYRGRQIGAGRKSLTLRCRFRAPERTLTHEEVDPQMNRLMAALRSALAAEIREQARCPQARGQHWRRSQWPRPWPPSAPGRRLPAVARSPR